MLYAVNPNPNGDTTGWSTMSPALFSPYFRSCHCLDSKYPPSCLYLFKSCPFFGGWIKFHLPHETSLPLPPWTACPHSLGIWPKLPSQWFIPLHLSPHSSKTFRTIKGKVHIFQVLVFLGPKRHSIQRSRLMCLFHLYLQPRSRSQ